LIAPTVYASSVYIEGKGWYLFGGNRLKTSQKLESLDSTWKEGPAVKEKGIFGQCIVQVIISNLLNILEEYLKNYFRSVKTSLLSSEEIWVNTS